MNTSNKKPLKKKVLRVFLILLLGFTGIQFIHPEIKNPPVKGDIQAPANVKAILQRACYDCHSNQTNLRWYDKVAPIYWTVAHHVKDGRAGLNFSDWGTMAPADQKGKLWEAVNQVIAGAMPIKEYEMVHPEAKISASDIVVLKNYLAGMVKDKPGDTAIINAANKQFHNWQNNKPAISPLPTALNGVAYMPDYKNWQPISSTERFDNGTMRIIFGNDIAVKAIKEKNIRPWPNGAIFAKVAWAQKQDKDGNVSTGEFKQIEYMIKDDKKYASTKGWGWARFKTAKMVPYGKSIAFTSECVNCHRPLKDADFVFTKPVKY